MSITAISKGRGLHPLNKAERGPVLSPDPPSPRHPLQTHDPFLREHEAEIIDAERFRIFNANLQVTTGRRCDVFQVPLGGPFNQLGLGFFCSQATDKFIVAVIEGQFLGNQFVLDDNIIKSLATPWIGRPDYNTYAYGSENWVFGSHEAALQIVALPVGAPSANFYVAVSLAISLMT